MNHLRRVQYYLVMPHHQHHLIARHIDCFVNNCYRQHHPCTWKTKSTHSARSYKSSAWNIQLLWCGVLHLHSKWVSIWAVFPLYFVYWHEVAKVKLMAETSFYGFCRWFRFGRTNLLCCTLVFFAIDWPGLSCSYISFDSQKVCFDTYITPPQLGCLKQK